MTGLGEKAGLATVLAEVTSGGGAAPGDGGRQLDLLSAAEEEPGASPLDLALAAMGEGFGTPRRGRGRPAGTRNRSTEDWRRLLLATRRSPMLVLADFYSMPVEELARRLRCDPIDAAKLQMDAAKALLPYAHQRLPQAVTMDVNSNLPMLIIQEVAELPRGSDGSDGLELVATEIVDYQYVSGEAVEHSDNAHSDGGAQVVETDEETADRPTDLGSVP